MCIIGIAFHSGCGYYMAQPSEHHRLSKELFRKLLTKCRSEQSSILNSVYGEQQPVYVFPDRVILRQSILDFAIKEGLTIAVS